MTARKQAKVDSRHVASKGAKGKPFVNEVFTPVVNVAETCYDLPRFVVECSLGSGNPPPFSKQTECFPASRFRNTRLLPKTARPKLRACA